VSSPSRHVLELSAEEDEIESVSQMGQVNDITKKIKSLERNLKN